MAYLAWHHKCGRQVTVKQTGLVLQSNDCLGCSPDGLVYDHSSKEQGLLEIKGPISAEGFPLSHAAEGSAHFFAKIGADDKLELRKNHDYFVQECEVRAFETSA